MKKQNSQVFLIFLFVLLIVSSTSARLMGSKMGAEKETRSYYTEHHETPLMGSEECAEKDEECLEGRMTAEAHLDYIYSQHRKP